MKKKYGGLFAVIAIFLVAMFALTLLPNAMGSKNAQMDDVIRLVKEEKIEEFIVRDNTLKLKLKDGTTQTAKIMNAGLLYEMVGDKLVKQVEEGKVKTFDFAPPSAMTSALSWLPSLLLLGGMVFFAVMIFKQMNSAKSNPFTKSRAKVNSDGGKKVLFSDVAGAKEEKEELEEIVEFLKAPRRFLDLGARIPKGVLLVGPPGTGKTLLAKAVAGEANVPFFSISGSDFVELYVGVGASRVRDLFENAKKNSPSIIFIDEIDAVGRRRGTGLGGGHDEREQTLNQMLVEMDGFGVNQGVIVIAATNRADVLDPALLRPGRFDRQITVGYPDLDGREEILKVHIKNKKIDEDVNLRTIAKGTVGFTGADLENVLNEAALLAAREERISISMKNIEKAITKVILGPEKRSHKYGEAEKRLTAYHEVGHAVAHACLPTQDKVHMVSIIPTGGAGGFTLSLPEEDKSYRSKIEMTETIVTLLAGRASERVMLDDISTGASNDIERATSIARSMITKYGMSERLGPMMFGSDNDEVFIGRDFGHTKNYSENVAAQIDEEIKMLIDTCYDKAIEIIETNKEKVELITSKLLDHEKLLDDEFYVLWNGSEDFDEYMKDKKIREEKELEIQRKIIEERKLEEARKAEEQAKRLEEEKEKVSSIKDNINIIPPVGDTKFDNKDDKKDEDNENKNE